MNIPTNPNAALMLGPFWTNLLIIGFGWMTLQTVIITVGLLALHKGSTNRFTIQFAPSIWIPHAPAGNGLIAIRCLMTGLWIGLAYWLFGWEWPFLIFLVVAMTGLVVRILLESWEST